MRYRAAPAFAVAALLMAGGSRATACELRGPVGDSNANGIPDTTFYGVGYGGSGQWDFTSIGDALQAIGTAPSDLVDIICIKAGTYDEGDLGIPSNVEIRVDGDVTIRAGEQDDIAIFFADTAASGTVIGDPSTGTGRLTLEPHAEATNQRGVLMQNGTFIEVRNTTFDGFHSTGNGGAASGLRGAVSGCTFINCTADGNGGAVYGWIDGSGTVYGTVSRCTFEDCSADGNGGAVASVATVTGATVNQILIETSIEDCTAGGNGGGIASVGSVVDCTIDGCTATGNGGGLYHINTQIRRTTVINCTAAGAGGGGIAESDGVVSQCRIAANTASNTGANMGRGGGLYKCCVGVISNNQVLSNTAEGQGGGMFDCDAPTKYNVFVLNHSEEEGGAGRNCDGPIRNCIFVENTADGGNANADMLSNSADPTFCFVHDAWSGGGHDNVRDDDDEDGEDVAGFVAFDPTDPWTDWDVHLATGSPCLNQGDPVNDVLIDYDGQTRAVAPNDTDIGIDERL